MEQINEDYVSFETAKLLKEKGFTLPVKNYYSLCIEDAKHNLQKKYGAKKNWNSFALAVSRPSQSLVMKWLRKVHKLHVDIDPSEGDWNPTVITLKDWTCAVKFGDNIPIQDSYEQACEAAIKYCLENLI